MYIQNTKTSRERTLRIELVGEVSELERHFLTGVSFFVAGTLSRDNAAHTGYVAQLLNKLIKAVLLHVRGEKGE